MPDNSARPATKADLGATKTELQQEIKSAKIELRAEIKSVKTELRAEIKSVKTELQEEIKSAKTELRAEIKSVKTELQEEIKSVKTELKKDITRLDQKIDRVAVEVVKCQSDIREIKRDMATKDDVARILTAIDAFAQKGENYDRAAVLHGHALVDVQINLKDHEARLKTLEAAG